jgi:hypothetical protein
MATSKPRANASSKQFEIKSSLRARRLPLDLRRCENNTSNGDCDQRLINTIRAQHMAFLQSVCASKSKIVRDLSRCEAAEIRGKKIAEEGAQVRRYDRPQPPYRSRMVLRKFSTNRSSESRLAGCWRGFTQPRIVKRAGYPSSAGFPFAILIA